MNKNFGSVASMPLGEAIQKMRAAEAEGDLTNKFSLEVEQAFEQHDAIHILFNCGTSIQDEIDVHVWLIFAATAKISEMHGVA
jgi:ubiquinone biosynthesis protein Coq4